MTEENIQTFEDAQQKSSIRKRNLTISYNFDIEIPMETIDELLKEYEGLKFKDCCQTLVENDFKENFDSIGSAKVCIDKCERHGKSVWASGIVLY